jgi:hypothetical protein
MNDIAAFSEAIEAGADINEKDEFGTTALHYSICEENHDIARLLLEYGADVTLQDDEGGTALHYAVEYNAIDVAKALLKHDKGVLSIPDSYGNHPLWTAVFKTRGNPENPEFVKLLLRYGAEVLHKNNVAASPLDLAQTIGGAAVIELLEKSLQPKAGKGVTPMAKKKKVTARSVKKTAAAKTKKASKKKAPTKTTKQVKKKAAKKKAVKKKAATPAVKPDHVLTKKEMKQFYGKFYKASPGAGLYVDADTGDDDVPEKLWPLFTYAEFWGISDDYERGELVDNAPPEIVENLKGVVAAFDDDLDKWLAGPEAEDPFPSDAYVAFTCMRMAALEA